MFLHHVYSRISQFDPRTSCECQNKEFFLAVFHRNIRCRERLSYYRNQFRDTSSKEQDSWDRHRDVTPLDWDTPQMSLDKTF
ncbi:hypothetical protein NY2A_b200L [Paramecium bursaria Chlorella virus NY2A]|uniref:Uncharacterized protein b200L n=1 Tax=Paramecium bursaria Chlorella virus NY2A TaxID=46021 RepID=A7IW75_PBCVN|nr:hypothetical protein NY2A_b200L [Paramecium bursaria Chlorella virus NY2A]ABT14599.1 hypothetical protein NY2A_b200L [Paramecium bursaria Chlorella virus NY2A]